MTKKQWTPEQQRVIGLKNKNMLVAAGAGSGKTAVLIERVLQKICDAQNPLDVDRMLIVTFTNAAAAEMRQRLSQALEEVLATDGQNQLVKRQLALLQLAPITTLHSFCWDLVKQYFYLLDIDPQCRVADEMEVALLQEDVLDKLLEQLYDANDASLQLLLEHFSWERNDNKLRKQLLALYGFSRSLPDSEKWLSCVADYYKEPFEDSKWQELFCLQVLTELTFAAETMAKACELAKEPGAPEKYLAIFQTEADDLENAVAAIKVGGMKKMPTLLAAIEFARLPQYRADDPNVDVAVKERLVALRKEAKEQVEKLQQECSPQKMQDMSQVLAAVSPVAEALVLVVKNFGRLYQQAKKTKKVIDFNDMEHFCLELLQQNDGMVAKELQQRFAEVLVDEYQDINRVQEKILSLLAKENNKFMVGDVKQSIYRFRQADPTLFLHKYASYETEENSVKIDLNSNFRSQPGIVYGVNYIFEQIMSRAAAEIEYDEKAHLQVGKIAEQVPIEVFLTDLAAVEEQDAESEGENIKAPVFEARLIAKRIKELAAEGVAYKDMVILLRSAHNKAGIFAEELNKAAIPCFAQARGGYFEAFEITTIVSLLQVIDNPRQDIPLAAVLHSQMFGFSWEELAQMRLAGEGEFFDALLVAAQKDEKAKVFLTNLLHWREMAKSSRISHLIWDIYQKTGYYQMVGSLPGGWQKQANLNFLLEQAREYELSSYRGLFRFLRFLARVLESGRDLGTARILGENEDVVRIMSVHQSKGLEFPVVFVAGLAQPFNISDRKGDMLLHNDFGIGLLQVDLTARYKYPSLAHNVIARVLAAENMAEEMRVLYVALTRASQRLILLGSKPDLAKDLTKWSDAANTQGRRLLPADIAKARSFLDWLLLVLLRHPDGRVLREYADFTGSVCLADWGKEKSSWQINIVDSHIEQIKEILSGELEPWQRAVVKRQKIANLPSDAEVARRLSWQYPQQNLSQIAAKWTITDLQKLAFALQDEAFAVDKSAKETPLPADSPFAVAQKGTLIHYVLQKLSLTDIKDVNSIGQQVASFGLTKEQMELLNIDALASFFLSPLGQRVLQAKETVRELPFIYAVPAKEIYEEVESEEKLLLQGTIDLAFKEGENWFIVDYKTGWDREETDAEVNVRFGTQLGWYKKGLQDIWRQPVAVCYVYFLAKGRVVEIK